MTTIDLENGRLFSPTGITFNRGKYEKMKKQAILRLGQLDQEIESMSDYAERSDSAFKKYRNLLDERRQLKQKYDL